MGLHRKFALLTEMKPDLAIVQECASPESIEPLLAGQRCTSSIWVGDNPRKGLGVFGLNGTLVEALPTDGPPIKYVLPLRVQGPAAFFLLAVWSFNNRGVPGRRMLPSPIQVAAERHRDILEQGRGIVVGDFNSSAIWDQRSKIGNFTSVAKYLEGLGLHSVYHRVSGEGYGQESQATHFWRDRAKNGHRYHIDYIFAPTTFVERTGQFSVGEFEKFCAGGISDHVPLIWDVELRQA
jgi:exodeoxyribonuclease III